MSHCFHADDVGFDEEDFDGAYPNVLTVGFGGVLDLDGYPTKSLILQRLVHDSSEDEGVYFEWCDQSNSCYNCVKSVELSRSSIKFVFDDNANFSVELDAVNTQSKLTELLINFLLDEQDFVELRDKLENVIFRNCDYFTYRSLLSE